MKLYISIPALVAAGLLSACSGNNTAEVTQFDAALGLAEAVAEADFDTITVADLPDSAEMTGNIGATFSEGSPVDVEEGKTIAYVGDVSVTADFAAGTMIGSADNFNEYEVNEETESATATRALDGTLAVTGNINDTFFDYYAFGALITEDDVEGTVVAETYLDGQGAFGQLEDGTLVAAGEGGGDVYLTTTESGYIGRWGLDSAIVLSE